MSELGTRLLRKFDREALDSFGAGQVTFSTTNQQRTRRDLLWVELKRIYEPDPRDHRWALQKYMMILGMEVILIHVIWEAILKTFGGNEATKKTKKNQLKQQYGNFKAEGIRAFKQTFNWLLTNSGKVKFHRSRSLPLLVLQVSMLADVACQFSHDTLPVDKCHSIMGSRLEGLYRVISVEGVLIASTVILRKLFREVLELLLLDDVSRNQKMDVRMWSGRFVARQDKCFNVNAYEIEFCAKKGIKREYSIARTPQQNGVAERKKGLLLIVLNMLADSILPIQFWAEAVNTAMLLCLLEWGKCWDGRADWVIRSCVGHRKRMSVIRRDESSELFMDLAFSLILIVFYLRMRDVRAMDSNSLFIPLSYATVNECMLQKKLKLSSEDQAFNDELYSDDDTPTGGFSLQTLFDAEESGVVTTTNLDPTIDVHSHPTLRVHKKFILANSNYWHKGTQRLVSQALADESWIEQMHIEELIQFKLQEDA
ncbi:putative ribonuclease H-like domain-containing protein [Tanacetum coccineum]